MTTIADPAGTELAGLHLALVAECYERGGWPSPDGRLRPLAVLVDGPLQVPLLDGTWRTVPADDALAAAHQLGRRAMVATTARAGFADLSPVRHADDPRYGELTVAASVHPRRIVVSGPGVPTVDVTRHGPPDPAPKRGVFARPDRDPAGLDPIGTRRPTLLTLSVNGRLGVLLPGPGGKRRDDYDVTAEAWGRRYLMRHTGPTQAEVLRNEERVARLLRGDDEPDRRYAVGWDPAADRIDRSVVLALASAFRTGA